MSKIKIFLASSLELKPERDQFEIEIRRKGQAWADKGVSLHLDIWEDLTARMSVTGSQSEYNKVVKECELFVLLAWTKMGTFTNEEFETAFGQFTETNKPFIFTYFKNTDKPEPSVDEFKNKLSELKHFHSPFRDFSHLWNQFNSELDRLLLNGFVKNDYKNTIIIDNRGANIGVQNTQLHYGGGDNIARDKIVNNFFGKSLEYRELKDRIAELEDDLAQINDMQSERAFKKSEALNNVRDQLKQFEKDVKEVAALINRINTDTGRLSKAAEHFQKGELREANAILQAELMLAEQDNLIKAKEETQTALEEIENKLQQNAFEFLLKARLTGMDYSMPGRFEKTKEYFERSLAASLNFDNINEYSLFLQLHNQHNEALPYLISAMEVCQRLALAEAETYMPIAAELSNRLANLFTVMNEPVQAEKYYINALQIIKSLPRINREYYLTYYEGVYLNNLGVLYKNNSRYDDALEIYTAALNIRRTLAANDPACLQDLAYTMHNLGVLYRLKNDFASAENAYKEALAIKRDLPQGNKQVYVADIALTLDSLGVVQKKNNDLQAAEKNYSEALSIYKELAEANPQTYIGDLSNVLNNMGGLYQAKQEYEKAIKTYKEALTIRRNLSINNPQTYLSVRGVTALNLSILYYQFVPEMDTSVEFAKEAISCNIQFLDSIPMANQYVNTGMEIINSWGLNSQKILDEIKEEMNQTLS